VTNGYHRFGEPGIPLESVGSLKSPVTTETSGGPSASTTYAPMVGEWVS